MKRPSFQFYPADWKNNAKLRRCSESARGAWIDILCILHDSDEYGILRWPLEDIARSAGVSIKSARELAEKDVLKGSDRGLKENFTHTTTHAGVDGDTFVLIRKTSSPCWFSSRMVVDEFIRQRRGGSTRFTPTRQPTRPVGEPVGDGPTSSSSSSSSSSSDKGSDKGSDKASRKPRLNKTQWAIASRFEACLNGQWLNDAGKWITRIKQNGDKSERVVAELENAAKEQRIATTPAQYAEQIWKEFA